MIFAFKPFFTRDFPAIDILMKHVLAKKTRVCEDVTRRLVLPDAVRSHPELSERPGTLHRPAAKSRLGLRSAWRDRQVATCGFENHHVFMGKSSINGPFSIANCMLTGGYHQGGYFNSGDEVSNVGRKKIQPAATGDSINCIAQNRKRLFGMVWKRQLNSRRNIHELLKELELKPNENLRLQVACLGTMKPLFSSNPAVVCSCNPFPRIAETPNQFFCFVFDLFI